jgi:hypothetical protein
MSEKLYRIKPLEWTAYQCGDEFAYAPTGRYDVTSHPNAFVLTVGHGWHMLNGGQFESASAAKRAADQHYRDTLAKGLEEAWKPKNGPDT